MTNRNIQKLRKAIIFTCVGLSLIFTLNTCVGCFTSGIVKIDDYDAGVAFCCDKLKLITFSPSDATFEYDAEHNIAFVINKGHEDDLDLVDLKSQAKYECAKFSEED